MFTTRVSTLLISLLVAACGMGEFAVPGESDEGVRDDGTSSWEEAGGGNGGKSGGGGSKSGGTSGGSPGTGGTSGGSINCDKAWTCANDGQATPMCSWACAHSGTERQQTCAVLRGMLESGNPGQCCSVCR